MKEETKKRINKLVLPLTKRTLSILSAATIITTGLASCKSETKDNTSDISTKITTSSEEDILVNDNNEIIDSSDEVVADNNSEIVNSDEKTSSTVKSGSTTTKTPGGNVNSSTKTSSSNTTNSGNKKTNGSTNNNPSNSASAPSSGTTTNPTPAPSQSQTAMPSALTSSNINDSAVFNHFANLLKTQIGGDIITYNGHMTQGYDEAKVALALMNYEYLNNTLISDVFGLYSKEQLNQFGDFMVVFVGMAADRKISLNYSKFFINKTIGNYVSSFGNEIVKVYKGQSNSLDSVVASFYDQNSSINYSRVNSWVNYYISFLCNLAYRECPGSIDGLSLGAGNFQEDYYRDINNLYTKSKVKIK